MISKQNAIITSEMLIKHGWKRKMYWVLGPKTRGFVPGLHIPDDKQACLEKDSFFLSATFNASKASISLLPGASPKSPSTLFSATKDGSSSKTSPAKNTFFEHLNLEGFLRSRLAWPIHDAEFNGPRRVITPGGGEIGDPFI